MIWTCRQPGAGSPWYKLWWPQGGMCPFPHYIVQDRAGWFRLARYESQVREDDIGPFESFDAAAACAATITE